MRRWVLSKRDRRRVAEEISQCIGVAPFAAKERVEILVDEGIEIILVEGVPAFIRVEELWIPHLKLIHRDAQLRSLLPKLVVDEGAVKAVLRGADVMRPGIVEVEGGFDKGALVLIVEPVKHMAIAVHRALYPSDEILKMSKGRVTKKLHYIGDKYWKAA